MVEVKDLGFDWVSELALCLLCFGSVENERKSKLIVEEEKKIN